MNVGKACTLLKKCILRPEPTITKVWFETTDQCNSRCSTCNIWKKEPTKELLTPKNIYKIFSDPVFKDVDYIINSGGEPTTREDLLLVLTAESYALPHATIQLSTNGLKPDAVIDVVTTMMNWMPRLKMEVGTSLDGIGPEHDSIRGVKGNFERVDYLLTELVKLRDKYGRERLGVSFGTVVTDRTINSIPALRSYAAEKGVGMLLQWYNESGFYENVRRDDDGLCTEKIKSEVKKADYSILSDMWCNYLEGKPIKFNCMALRSFVAIKCNGDIIPCLSHWNLSVGNVREHTPTEILTKSPLYPNFYNQCDVVRDCVVDGCDGCLNSWGTYWSFEADPLQYVKYFSRHPIKLLRKLCA